MTSALGPRPRVVVVGNGYGATCQIPALVWAGEADVVAVVGRDRTKAQATAARHAIPLGTNDLSEALATQPDLVLVSTPPRTHREIVRAVIEKTDAALVCEKPLAHTTDDAGAIAALVADDAARRGRARIVVVDHQLRWSPARRALRDAIRDGVLGEVRHVRSEMTFSSLARITRAHSWWDDASEGGGALLAIGSHLIDGVMWLLGGAHAGGAVTDVRARLQRFVRERAVADGDAAAGLTTRAVTSDDGAELWLTHASGATSTITVSTARLLGGRAVLEVDGARGWATLDEGAPTPSETCARVAFVDGTTRVLDGSLPAIDDVRAVNPSAFARCEPLFLRDVVRAVAQRANLPVEAATIADAVATQEVIARALRSSTELARPG
jgi:predicted dehydrogenase